MMMMMIGETRSSNPTVQVPPWDDDPTANMVSPYSVNLSGNADYSPFDALTALHRYLPSNMNSFGGGTESGLMVGGEEEEEEEGEDYDEPVDAFACDHFRMFEFKVRRCARGRSHDWTECPYAHPGEKARRRDPRKFHYSGNACPDFRKGSCVKGDACEYAHGVFECWLHPARYRTQPCKDGTHCRRRVCFFAHTPDQLRVVPPQTSPRNREPMTESYDGSPRRLGFESFVNNASFGSSPTSSLYSPPVSPPSDSPPLSPVGNSACQLAASMRNLQIGKARMSMSPPSWGFQMGTGLCSPRSPSTLRPAFMSLPSTPTRGPTRSGLGAFDLFDKSWEEEPVMERVESGRDLRAKIYAKLSKDNSVGRVDSAASGPDVGWISELVK